VYFCVLSCVSCVVCCVECYYLCVDCYVLLVVLCVMGVWGEGVLRVRGDLRVRVFDNRA